MAREARRGLGSNQLRLVKQLVIHDGALNKYQVGHAANTITTFEALVHRGGRAR